MAKKSFFRERTVKEIKDLAVAQASHQRGLVERIDALVDNEALIIRVRITPGRFFQGRLTGEQASRKCLKHGDLLYLDYPKTQQEAYECTEIPLAFRAKALSKLEEMKEEEINFVGLCSRVDWGDRIRRIFPFAFAPEGARLFAYTENCTTGIEIEPYADSQGVKKYGANIVVTVPSRTKKNPRYQYRLLHVPMKRDQRNLASIIQLKPQLIQDKETGEPLSGRTPHDLYNIRYPWEGARQGSEVITFYPHDLATYVAIIEQERAKYNLTPLEMNPFILISRHGAEFYKKLGNNVLIYDPSLTSKEKLRHLHLDEKSILLARAIGKFKHDNFAYWDEARDGRLSDYDWSLKE